MGGPDRGASCFETHRYAMLLSMRMRDFAWLFDIVKWDDGQRLHARAAVAHARTASHNGAGQGGRSERYFDAESVLSMATAS